MQLYCPFRCIEPRHIAMALPLAAPLSEAFYVVMQDCLDEIDGDGLQDLFAKF